MRRTLLALPLLWLGACGTAPQGITYTGIPIDEGATNTYIKAFATFAGADASRVVSGTVDVRPFEAFLGCGSHATPCPHASLGWEPFYLVTDAPLPGFDLRTTGLAHELAHVLFGDPEHGREDLWGVTGVVARWNGYVEGQDPATRQWMTDHGR